ncbi:hypothetical protein [Piscinibacter terrae]|uniref:Uncharacterized protein n=1 Tax=Piscinibacter terrae TaxID=2496871 RepID=A0A3N7HRX4_9BURK|nr:hypothetical protein [Albitalea terrae]RQP24503.1 hypothetical protein DZC73_14560 [Albitalea terrae]
MSRPVPPAVPDADRDAWLSEALRHAPDADVAPPASLSEMILREAQAKAKPAEPAPRPPVPWWTRLWVWSAKPAVGAGLASVLVASLVGVMMWDRPLQDSSPRSRTDLPVPAAAPAAPPPPAAAPHEQAATAGAAATAADQVAAQAPVLAKPSAQDKRTPEVVADAMSRKKLEAAVDDAKRRQHELLTDAQRQAEQPAKALAAKEERQRDAALKAEPDALSKAARTAEAMSPAAPAVTVAPKPAAERMAAVPAPVPPPPVAAVPVAPAPALALALAPAPAPAPAPMPSTATAPMAAPAAGLARSRMLAQEAKPGASNFAAGGQPVVRLEEDTQAFVALRAALTAEPAPWTWQRDGGPSHAVDDTLGAFLAQVDVASQAGWASSTEVIVSGQVGPAESELAKSDASAAGKPVVRTVRLLRDGKPAHVLRLAGRSLVWERDGSAPARRTVRVIQLDERQLQALRAALDRLTP